MKVGDRVRLVYGKSKTATRGTVRELKDVHASVQWDGWGTPRWIQKRLLTKTKKRTKPDIND
jgi:hypothetical protein